MHYRYYILSYYVLDGKTGEILKIMKELNMQNSHTKTGKQIIPYSRKSLWEWQGKIARKNSDVEP